MPGVSLSCYDPDRIKTLFPIKLTYTKPRSDQHNMSRQVA